MASIYGFYFKLTENNGYRFKLDSYNLDEFKNLYLDNQGYDKSISKFIRDQAYNLHLIEGIDESDKANKEKFNKQITALFNKIVNIQKSLILKENMSEEDFIISLFSNLIDNNKYLSNFVSLYTNGHKLFDVNKFPNTMSNPMFIVSKPNSNEGHFVFLTKSGYFVECKQANTLDINKVEENNIIFKDRFGINMKISSGGKKSKRRRRKYNKKSKKNKK